LIDAHSSAVALIGASVALLRFLALVGRQHPQVSDNFMD
jgi:hypothetical protein